MTVKSDVQTFRICSECRLILNPQLRRCGSVIMGSDDSIKCILGNRYFSRIALVDANLQIVPLLQSMPVTTVPTPESFF